MFEEIKGKEMKRLGQRNPYQQKINQREMHE